MSKRFDVPDSAPPRRGQPWRRGPALLSLEAQDVRHKKGNGARRSLDRGPRRYSCVRRGRLYLVLCQGAQSLVVRVAWQRLLHRLEPGHKRLQEGTSGGKGRILGEELQPDAADRAYGAQFQ